LSQAIFVIHLDNFMWRWWSNQGYGQLYFKNSGEQKKPPVLALPLLESASFSEGNKIRNSAVKDFVAPYTGGRDPLAAE